MAGRTARYRRSRTAQRTRSPPPAPAWRACSQVAAGDLTHRVGNRARREGHVGERRIHARRARHARAVRDEQVGHVVGLIVRVEHRCLRVPAHARCSHLVHAEPRRAVVVVRLDVLAPGGLEHLGRLGLHVFADGALIVAPGALHAQQRDPPLVRALGVEIDVVLVPRQALTVSLKADPPGPRLTQLSLQVRSQAGHVRAAAPPVAPGSALDAIPPQEGDLRLPAPAQVSETRDVRARGTAAVHVLVLEARHGAVGAGLGDVIHQVVADFAARVGEPGRKPRRFRVQEDLGRAEGRGAEKDQPSGVLARLFRIAVDHAHARRPVRALVVDHAVHDRVGDDGEFAGALGRRQRRAQAREIAAVAAAPGTLVARPAGPAALVRLREIRDPRDGHVTAGEGALDAPPHDLLGAIQSPGPQELAVGQVREAQPLAAHADEALDVAVPGGQVLIADGPVDAVAVFQIRREIEIAPAPAQPAPDQAAPAELVASDPTERLAVGSSVGMLAIVYEEVAGRLAERVVLALDGIVALVQLLLALAAVRELPGLEPLRDVVLAVLHAPAALEHQRLEPLLAQFLGGPAAGYP